MTKMTIILEDETRDPIVIENAKGILALIRNGDVVRKCLIGSLSNLDMALMIKSIPAGSGPECERLRKAFMAAVMLPDITDDQIIDETPGKDGLNNPFEELN